VHGVSSSLRPSGARHGRTRSRADDPGEVYVVANRLPIAWDDGRGWVRAPGGLVTALDDLIRRRPLGWFGSEATLHGAPERPPASCWPGALHVVHIDDHLGADAVIGCANGTLWPALHGFGELVEHHTSWWDAYVDYNRAFAGAVANVCAEGDRIWVHDYHLLLLPGLLAERRPDLRVGLSLHTAIDRAGVEHLPIGPDLARALRRCAMIGVQTTADAASLRGLLDDHGGAAGIAGAPTPHIVTSPVSIDPSAIEALLDEPATTSLRERWRRHAAGRRLLVGVDRLDYTKGIVPRLRAYDQAFAHGWLDPAETLVVQIAQPSRTELGVYRALHTEAERLAHDLRCRWRGADGAPAIELVVAGLDRREVIALFAEADVGVVTPARDGMNLVSKEFSIANEPRGGVLVLSRSAGAAEELGRDSVLVDGDQAASVAAGLRRAARLDPETRRAMARRRAARVRSWSAANWSSAYLAHLGERPIRRETS
jgi:trehalose-6-phosphate synthase